MARHLTAFPAMLRFVVALALVLPMLSPAAAQGPDNVLQNQREAIDTIKREVNALAEQVRDEPADDAALVDIRVELEKLAREVFDAILEFRPQRSEVDTRLEQLGPARGEGEQPEPEAVQRERRQLLDQKASFNVLIGEAERLSVRINNLIDKISQARRDLFTRNLSRRYDVSGALGAGVASEFVAEVRQVYELFSSWVRFVISYKLRASLVATALALVAALLLLFGGRRTFRDFIEPDPHVEAPTYLARMSVALFSTLIPSVALAVFLACIYYFLDYLELLRPHVAQLLWSFFSVLVIVAFVYRLVHAVLLPKTAEWRLVPVRSQAAGWLVLLAGLTAGVTGFDFFMDNVYEVLGSQLSLTVATSFVATCIVGLLVILIGAVKPLTDAEGTPRPWPFQFRYLLFFLGGAIIVAAALGYIGFARFVSQQIVVTGAILATMYIGMLTAGAIKGEGAFANSWIAQRLERFSAFDSTTLDQFGLAASILINLLVVLIGVPLILLQWGFHWADLTAWAHRATGPIPIGSFSFSLSGVLTGVLVFFVGYFFTRWFQAWLDGSVMARSRMDSGVRNSIRTATGYAGIVVAVLLGISAAGISLSNLALVAGALSLGIGFGLQNIVSNFVSGLILLVERPFKAGDWIVAGTVSGTVKKISVRATEIETFQRQTIILPNSELINAAVGNWTHKNSLGRVEVAVSVARDSDVRRVHEILLDIAGNHPLVLKNPEPFVLFSGFGEYTLDFEIRVYLADILMQLDVQNDIRFAVVEAFAAEGIEMPFPQRDLRLREGGFVPAGRAARDTDEEDARAPDRHRRGRAPDPE